MIIPPIKCSTPMIRSVAKKRSANMPTKKGEIIPAIGPTEYVQPISVPEKLIFPRNR